MLVQKMQGGLAMKVPFGLIAVCAFASLCAPPAYAQQNSFPLAALAGVDSKARQVAPAGAVNQGPFDANAWKYGSIMARELTKAGLTVVGLERGAPKSPQEDFALPRIRDELKYRVRQG
jgi:hypothetical protein